MRLKDISYEKSDLFAYMRFCACEKKKKKKQKSLHNKNVAPIKAVKFLYEQKLVYWDRLKN